MYGIWFLPAERAFSGPCAETSTRPTESGCRRHSVTVGRRVWIMAGWCIGRGPKKTSLVTGTTVARDWERFSGRVRLSFGGGRYGGVRPAGESTRRNATGNRARACVYVGTRARESRNTAKRPERRVCVRLTRVYACARIRGS